MYGNCLDLSSGAFDTYVFCAIAFDSRSTMLLHLGFVTLSIFYGPVSRVFHPVRWVPAFSSPAFPPLHFSSEFFSPAFSVSLSEVLYYFLGHPV